MKTWSCWMLVLLQQQAIKCNTTAIKMMCWLISSLIVIENIDFKSVFMVSVS